MVRAFVLFEHFDQRSPGSSMGLSGKNSSAHGIVIEELEMQGYRLMSAEQMECSRSMMHEDAE